MNVDTINQLQQFQGHSLLAILDQTYNCFCATNPEDKVFGILGLCVEVQGTHWPAALEPNYRLPPGKVFRDVARYLIESTGSLAILSFVCAAGQCDEMPSWVPDLTGSLFYRGGMNEIFLEEDGKVGLRIRTSYRATLGLPLKLDTRTDRDILALRGLRLDTVVFQLEENYSISLGLQALTAGERARSHRVTFKKIKEKLALFGSTKRFSTAPTAESIMESGALSPSLLRIWMSMVDLSGTVESWDVEELALSFHRITTAGQGANTLPFDSEEEELHSFKNCCAYLVKALKTHPTGSSEYHKGFLERNSPLGDPDAFFATARKWCPGRRFFRTADGLMGMGPGTMKEGDVLCLLFGSAVPYILRPKDGRYIFVGDCYVDALMEGQALLGIIDNKLFVAFGGGIPHIIRPKDGPYTFLNDCDVGELLRSQASSRIIGEKFEIV
jgi:hypothetical protein